MPTTKAGRLEAGFTEIAERMRDPAPGSAIVGVVEVESALDPLTAEHARKDAGSNERPQALAEPDV